MTDSRRNTILIIYAPGVYVAYKFSSMCGMTSFIKIILKLLLKLLIGYRFNLPIGLNVFSTGSDLFHCCQTHGLQLWHAYWDTCGNPFTSFLGFL